MTFESDFEVERVQCPVVTSFLTHIYQVPLSPQAPVSEALEMSMYSRELDYSKQKNHTSKLGAYLLTPGPVRVNALQLAIPDTKSQ